MLAEEVVLPERAWVKVPSRYSFEQASTLPCAGVTAWHALFEAAEVKPGETVPVQGAEASRRLLCSSRDTPAHG